MLYIANVLLLHTTTGVFNDLDYPWGSCTTEYNFCMETVLYDNISTEAPWLDTWAEIIKFAFLQGF